MYIQKVKLQNFRSFGDEGICFLFNKGINAVIGENNNGKNGLDRCHPNCVFLCPI